MPSPTNTTIAGAGTPPTHASAAAPVLALGALGVVYGDIGTSPLYALREAVKAAAGGVGGMNHAAVIAATSAVIWALIVIVAIKYALLILRADNRGEGGIMAMLALLGARSARPGRQASLLVIIGLTGAALLYGDGAITPAVSVLSAVEGLKTDAPKLAPFVVPLTIVIIVALFAAQREGTGKIGRVFGPVMVLWFLAIAAIGATGIVRAPGILAAFNPLNATAFLAHAGFRIDAALLGAAFLAVTGGEAMYADLGHFGAGAVRLAWFAVVMPALLLNYLGQGALLLTQPGAIDNPFYKLAPDWAHYPLVGFATMATVIASQAIISGAFSLTKQAIQLGFLPPLRVMHTDKAEIGQVYLPLVNVLLAVGTLAAVLVFRSSDALAGAYGIAVSLLMVITTLLAALIARQWGYPLLLVVLVNGGFAVIDLGFFGANSVKIFQGGWFPLAIAGMIAVLMLTWRRGTQLTEAARSQLRLTTEEVVARMKEKPPLRSPGTAAFLTPSADSVPLALSRLLGLTGTLPERVLLLTLQFLEVPIVADADRIEVKRVNDEVRRVIVGFGFTENVHIPRAMALAVAQGKLDAADLDDLVYYFSKETVLPTREIPGMALWRENLFAVMQSGAERPATYFCVPAARVIDIGTEIEI